MSYNIGVALQNALAGLVAGRVYPVRLPDEPVFASIRYSDVTTNYFTTLCGQSNLSESRYRLDVFATTIIEAEQIAASIQSIMRGNPSGFQNVPLGAFDGYEPAIAIYRKTLDFQIWEAQSMAAGKTRLSNLNERRRAS
jgi:hypothetical protein